jgi:hypothetical protein
MAFEQAFRDFALSIRFLDIIGPPIKIVSQLRILVKYFL